MIDFKIVEKKDPQTGKTKYYAQITKVVRQTSKIMKGEIEKRSTLSTPDLLAFGNAMAYEIVKAICAGRSVTIAHFGSFRPTFRKARGYASYDEAKKNAARDFVSPTIRFVPCTEWLEKQKANQQYAIVTETTTTTTNP